MQNSTENIFQNNMHNDTFWQAAIEMREKDKHCDFTVKSNDGKKFNVHKIILATMSPYFDVLFNGEMRENSESSVSFSDIDSTILNEIVNYMYTGKIRINDDNVELLFDAANYFQIEWIVEKCEEHLKGMLNYINCWHLYKFADAYSRQGLMEYCRHYMAQHFKEFIVQKSYLEMTYDEFNNLISRCFDVSESAIYTAIIDWVKHKIDDRKIHLQSLLSEVNFASIRTNFLLQHVMQEPILQLLQNDASFKDDLWNAIKRQLYSDKKDVENVRRTKFMLRPSIFIPKSCRMYNVPDFNFAIMPPLPNKMRQFSAICAKKKIFMFGGLEDATFIGPDCTWQLRCVQVFDPIRQLWSTIDGMPTERFDFGICALNDLIYLCGGATNPNKVDVYNLETCKWMAGYNMHFQRNTKCVALSNVMYCVEPNKHVINFDPREGLWKELSSPNITETEFCLVSDDKWCIYKIGTNGNEIYDIRNNQWAELPDLNLPRTKHGAATLDGYVYVFGGQCTRQNGSATSVEIYDPKENNWVTSKSAKIICDDASSAVLYIP